MLQGTIQVLGFRINDRLIVLYCRTNQLINSRASGILFGIGQVQHPILLPFRNDIADHEHHREERHYPNDHNHLANDGQSASQ